MILTTISNLIVHLISAAGYAGVAFLMAIESTAIPLPSEVIMPFAGSLVAIGRFSLFGVALAGAVGSVIGSAILYYIGAYGGRPLVERYGKYVLISHHDLHTAEKFFTKYGNFSNFIARLLPVVRTFISFPAGIARVEIKSFLLYSFIGSFIWSYFLAYIGFKLGSNWDSIKPFFHKFDYLIIAIAVIAIVLYVYRHIRHARAL